MDDDKTPSGTGGQLYGLSHFPLAPVRRSCTTQPDLEKVTLLFDFLLTTWPTDI